MISQRVILTQSPPLHKLGQLANQTKDCISLGQGAPYYYPPSWIFESLNKSIPEPATHSYSPDPGVFDLRKILSDKMNKENKISCTPESIVITPGANQAFFNCLLTITDPGDEVILLGPYYFNHHMACTLANVTPIEVALNSDFSIPYQSILNHITVKTRAIVLVNPGNPTGMVHTLDEIRQLQEIGETNNLWLISDETYEYFIYSGKKHQPLCKRASSSVITITSFSKTFGIPGWRLGYYQGPEDFINESLKTQDTLGICAPTVSQHLGIILFKNKEKIVPDFVALMQNNHSTARDLLEEISWLESTPSHGAYYLFPKSKLSRPSMDIAYDLIINNKVYLVPGDGFGKSGKDFFRISFANVGQEGLKEAFSRLRAYS